MRCRALLAAVALTLPSQSVAAAQAFLPPWTPGYREATALMVMSSWRSVVMRDRTPLDACTLAGVAGRDAARLVERRWPERAAPALEACGTPDQHAPAASRITLRMLELQDTTGVAELTVMRPGSSHLERYHLRWTGPPGTWGIVRVEVSGVTHY